MLYRLGVLQDLHVEIVRQRDALFSENAFGIAHVTVLEGVVLLSSRRQQRGHSTVVFFLLWGEFHLFVISFRWLMASDSIAKKEVRSRPIRPQPRRSWWSPRPALRWFPSPLLRSSRPRWSAWCRERWLPPRSRGRLSSVPIPASLQPTPVASAGPGKGAFRCSARSAIPFRAESEAIFPST